VAPHQIGVREFSDYALVIDARSPREYVEDHLPLAVNLPVVNDDQSRNPEPKRSASSSFCRP